MSALGQKQTFALQKTMSALRPKADTCAATKNVCYRPKADIVSIFEDRARHKSAIAGDRLQNVIGHLSCEALRQQETLQVLIRMGRQAPLAGAAVVFA